MILAITIHEMQRLNVACRRVLGDAEWARRSTVAWESLRDQGMIVTADILASAIMDGVNIGTGGVHFDRKEAGALLALADYMGSGFVGEHTKTIAMIRRKVPK